MKRPLRGDGHYLIEVVSCEEERPLRRNYSLCVLTLRVLESDNPDHPVGATRHFCVRILPNGRLWGPADQEAYARLQVGSSLVVETRAATTRAGMDYTRFEFGETVTWSRAVGRVPNVQYLPRPIVPPEASIAYGATCKRCREHNPHTEARADFVCYGCRIAS